VRIAAQLLETSNFGVLGGQIDEEVIRERTPMIDLTSTIHSSCWKVRLLLLALICGMK
jgi:hypothetical protein